MSKHFRVASRMPAKMQELGIPVDAVLQRAGLAADTFAQPRVLLTTEEFFAFWRAIGAVSPDPSHVLALGTASKTEQFDPIVLAALSSGSFGEAMRKMAMYKTLSCPEEILLEDAAEELRVEFKWLLAQENEPESLRDHCFAWVLTIARHGTGTDLMPLRLELEGPRAKVSHLEKHFGCAVRFGAARNAIVFRASDAALPFVTRNEELLAMLAPQLDAELKLHRGEETFPERVRAKVQQRLAGRRPKMQEIAREMKMSSRTLQRRLQDAGYSFQQVLEEARHQLARYYLTNKELELNETAYLLGYEDANSFVRAFRGWEGAPPGHWRNAQRAQMSAYEISV
jgi:AraC-like DNA-binding protein